jgi:hypothetical protein
MYPTRFNKNHRSVDGGAREPCERRRRLFGQLRWITVLQIAQSPYHGIISSETIACTTAGEFFRSPHSGSEARHLIAPTTAYTSRAPCSASSIHLAGSSINSRMDLPSPAPGLKTLLHIIPSFVLFQVGDKITRTPSRTGWACCANPLYHKAGTPSNPT